MRLDDAELERLLAQGESFRVERKETLAGSAPDAIREAICAFANDLPGEGKPGVILVGVKNNGDPSGLEITDRMLLQLTDMKTDGNIVPPPSLLVEKRSLKGVDIAVVTVEPSDSPPVRFKGVICVRSGPRKGIATAQDERVLNEKRRFQNKPFDIQPITGLDISVLNLRAFDEEYLPRAFSPTILAENDRTTEQRLAATKMIASADVPIPTVVGVLVLGKTPRDLIENSYVQFLRIAGLELSDNVVDNALFDGTVAEILHEIDDKLKSHIHTSVDITGADREVRRENYPLPALQQIVRNAIMHRTYEATNAPVRVLWFKDRIEVWNPGGPYGLVTRENFGRPGIVDYRNPNLAEAMKVLGYVQRFGAGFGIARRWLREADHPELTFNVEDNFVQIVVWGRDT
jgi:ATP-dependent DNA helicase RecG